MKERFLVYGGHIGPDAISDIQNPIIKDTLTAAKRAATLMLKKGLTDYAYIYRVFEKDGKIVAYAKVMYRYLAGNRIVDYEGFVCTLICAIREYTANPSENVGLILKNDIVLTYENGSFVLRDAFREYICPDSDSVFDNYEHFYETDIVTAVAENRPFILPDGREWKYTGEERDSVKLLTMCRQELGCDRMWYFGDDMNMFRLGK